MWRIVIMLLTLGVLAEPPAQVNANLRDQYEENQEIAYREWRERWRKAGY
jgi:hypothetical protein